MAVGKPLPPGFFKEAGVPRVARITYGLTPGGTSVQAPMLLKTAGCAAEHLASLCYRKPEGFEASAEAPPIFHVIEVVAPGGETGSPWGGQVIIVINVGVGGRGDALAGKVVLRRGETEGTFSVTVISAGREKWFERAEEAGRELARGIYGVLVEAYGRDNK